MSKTVLKALAVLELIAQEEHPVSRRTLLEASGLDRSTLARILGTLESAGMVRCDPESRSYSVGIKLVSWAGSFMRGTDLRRLAVPILHQLRDESRETTTLHIRTGLDRVCVDGVESPEDIRRVVLLGERVPLHMGTSGKVILAHMDPKDASQVVERARDDGLGSIETLGEQLDVARRSGYLSLADDRVAGVGSVSVPIFEAGSVIGTFSVTGPSNRWCAEHREGIAPLMIELAGRVSASLGSDAANAGRTSELMTTPSEGS